MTRRPAFEEFQYDSGSVDQLVDVARETVEDQKLKSFEDGYNAGWADSVAAQLEAKTFLTDALAQSLKEIKLNQRDALEEALQITFSALSDILQLFLPSLSKKHIHDIVLGIVETRNLSIEDVHVCVATSSGDFDTILSFIDPENLGIRVSKNPKVSDGQILVSTGLENIEIDISETGNALLSEIGAFLKSLREEKNHV